LPQDPGDGVREHAINYPGNPRVRPRCAHRMAATTTEMNHRDRLLAGHAILVSDDVPMRVSTRDEVREIILQHFGIHKD
jgi:hypothetical protein